MRDGLFPDVAALRPLIRATFPACDDDHARGRGARSGRAHARGRDDGDDRARGGDARGRDGGEPLRAKLNLSIANCEPLRTVKRLSSR